MQLSEAILFDLSWLFFGAWAIVLLASTWAVFGEDFCLPAQARQASTSELLPRPCAALRLNPLFGPDRTGSPHQQLAPSPAKISSTNCMLPKSLRPLLPYLKR